VLVATRKQLRDIEMALKVGKATRPMTSLNGTVRGAAARAVITTTGRRSALVSERRTNRVIAWLVPATPMEGTA
jgi:hypothetical protein